MLYKKYKYSKIFVAIFVFSLLFFEGRMNANARVEELNNFVLGGESGISTVYATYDEQGKRLLIHGFGRIEKNLWENMVKRANDSDITAWTGEEDYDIEFKAEGANRMIYLPLNSSNLFELFDGRIFFVNSNGETQVDTRDVYSMAYMFSKTKKFNQPLGDRFYTNKVSNMHGMFSSASNFNQALGEHFDTSNVADMGNMFASAKKFNQPLGDKFDTSSVKFMTAMFADASNFNQSLGGKFKTTNVVDMSYIFNSAKSFNQNVVFDLKKVRKINGMFHNCSGMNKRIILKNASNNTDVSAVKAFDFNKPSKVEYIKFSGLKDLKVLSFNDDYYVKKGDSKRISVGKNTSFNFDDNFEYIVYAKSVLKKPIIIVDDFEKTYDGNTVTMDDINPRAEYSSRLVEGTFAFEQIIDPIISAGEYNIEILFEPDDTHFRDAKEIVNIKINKATVTGNVAYDGITEEGKTLADANLRKDGITLSGTLTWDLPEDTVVENNVSYDWTFVPDNPNYENLTGSIVLMSLEGQIEPTSASESSSESQSESSSESETETMSESETSSESQSEASSTSQTLSSESKTQASTETKAEVSTKVSDEKEVKNESNKEAKNDEQSKSKEDNNNDSKVDNGQNNDSSSSLDSIYIALIVVLAAIIVGLAALLFKKNKKN